MINLHPSKAGQGLEIMAFTESTIQITAKPTHTPVLRERFISINIIIIGDKMTLL
jgi:hypothetical protein